MSKTMIRDSSSVLPGTTSAFGFFLFVCFLVAIRGYFFLFFAGFLLLWIALRTASAFFPVSEAIWAGTRPAPERIASVLRG
ncbi:MAG: hypothetical protein ACJ76D_01600 [Solirubrobacterales bacterium]